MALISFDDARKQLLDAAIPLLETEDVPLEQCFGRVLGSDMYSPFDVPHFDNSAMDGYAICAADLASNGNRLRVAQRIAAGAAPAGHIDGTAARIFTGAPMPRGADTVVMQEHCRVEGEWVQIDQAVTTGQHVRKQGHEIRSGQVVLSTGSRLTAAHLGLAASLGLATLPVIRKLRIAIFFTGSELVAPGMPLQPGQIYNSNRFVLLGMLAGLGLEVIDLGIVPDNLDTTCETLRIAASRADVILTSGGMSVGEEDHVRAAVEKTGHLAVWKIAVKPGKPLAFGQIGDAAFIGLPGNPVSVWVGMSTIVLPYLRKRQGMLEFEVTRQRLVADFSKRTGERREFVRVRVNQQGVLSLHPNQDSGALSSAAWASGLADIPANTAITPGQPVDYWPAPGFGHS